MQAVGIICEYNPLHPGHLWQMRETRRILGEDTAIVCAMSGNFVQRGEPAIVRKHARARAAVASGADLVLELPLPWALASAERFARGGVSLLQATGVVSHLSFGSECGDISALRKAAEAVSAPAFSEALRRRMAEGLSYAAAMQRAAEDAGCPEAALLRSPNDILAVEYCKAIVREGGLLTPVCVPRLGPAHDGGIMGGMASASHIRQRLLAGEDASALMAPEMAKIYAHEAALGRAPAALETMERAILSRLRTMTREEMARYDEGKEGLSNRFYAAAREACSLEELLEKVKTKRYHRSRLSRMLLWMYLDMPPVEMQVPYLRVLACGARGREVLARMRKTATAPVLVKPADVRQMHPQAREVFALEARATDLYTLAYPDLAQAAPGSEWREDPVIL